MIKERILELLSIYNLSVSEFADKINVPRSSMSHITSGRNKPSLDFVIKVKESFPSLNTDWIIFGKGEMYIKSDEKDLKKHQPVSEETRSYPTLFEQQKSENDVDEKQIDAKKIANSNEDQKNNENTAKKQLRNVMFFYTDGTFETFRQSLSSNG